MTTKDEQTAKLFNEQLYCLMCRRFHFRPIDAKCQGIRKQIEPLRFKLPSNCSHIRHGACPDCHLRALREFRTEAEGEIVTLSKQLLESRGRITELEHEVGVMKEMAVKP